MLVSDVAVQVRILIVRTQHELLAILLDELDQIDRGAFGAAVAVRSLARLYDAGPRHVFLDRFAFVRRELRGERIFRKQGEHRLLVRKLRTKTVYHANLV